MIEGSNFKLLCLDKEMVVSGGIENAQIAASNIHEASHLSSDHEDVDTRMALHA